MKVNDEKKNRKEEKRQNSDVKRGSRSRSRSKSRRIQCDKDHNNSLVCQPVTAVSLLLGRLFT